MPIVEGTVAAQALGPVIEDADQLVATT